MTQFTVAIPVYNGERFLEEALQSIEAQDLDGVEVLVSDNNSSDETAAILERWKERLPLRVITRERTMPMQAHFNALLDAVTGDAYMLLCHDDYLADPDALASARAVLRDHPDVAAVYSDIAYVDEQRRPLATRDFSREGTFDPHETGKSCLKTGRNLFGIPIAVRRSALGELRYDPDFLYAMDLDLSWALAPRGKAFHIDRTLVANRYSDSNMTWKLLDTTQQEYLRLARKHVGAPGPMARARLAFVCRYVTLQKLAFRYYARLRAKVA